MIGVELLTRYVQSLLPYSELQNDGFGAYLLARSPDTTQDSSMTLHRVVTSAADSDRSQSGVFAVDMQSESGGWTRFDGWRCYASVVPLSLYSRNAPFSEEATGCWSERSRRPGCSRFRAARRSGWSSPYC